MLLALLLLAQAGEIEPDDDPSVGRLHDYLSSSFPFTWCITIVDNASTDDTLAVATALSERWPEVRVRHLDRKGRGLALRDAG